MPTIVNVTIMMNEQATLQRLSLGSNDCKAADAPFQDVSKQQLFSTPIQRVQGVTPPESRPFVAIPLVPVPRHPKYLDIQDATENDSFLDNACSNSGIYLPSVDSPENNRDASIPFVRLAPRFDFHVDVDDFSYVY